MCKVAAQAPLPEARGHLPAAWGTGPLGPPCCPGRALPPGTVGSLSPGPWAEWSIEAGQRPLRGPSCPRRDGNSNGSPATSAQAWPPAPCAAEAAALGPGLWSWDPGCGPGTRAVALGPGLWTWDSGEAAASPRRARDRTPHQAKGWGPARKSQSRSYLHRHWQLLTRL